MVRRSAGPSRTTRASAVHPSRAVFAKPPGPAYGSPDDRLHEATRGRLGHASPGSLRLRLAMTACPSVPGTVRPSPPGFDFAPHLARDATSGRCGARFRVATVMVIMAEAYGADIRLVAFTQYLSRHGRPGRLRRRKDLGAGRRAGVDALARPCRGRAFHGDARHRGGRRPDRGTPAPSRRSRWRVSSSCSSSGQASRASWPPG